MTWMAVSKSELTAVLKVMENERQEWAGVKPMTSCFEYLFSSPVTQLLMMSSKHQNLPWLEIICWQTFFSINVLTSFNALIWSWLVSSDLVRNEPKLLFMHQKRFASKIQNVFYWILAFDFFSNQITLIAAFQVLISNKTIFGIQYNRKKVQWGCPRGDDITDRVLTYLLYTRARVRSRLHPNVFLSDVMWQRKDFSWEPANKRLFVVRSLREMIGSNIIPR